MNRPTHKQAQPKAKRGIRDLLTLRQGDALTAEQLAWVPEQFVGPDRTFNSPTSPDQFLRNAGFASRVADDRIHRKRLPEVGQIQWGKNLLFYGPYHTGKTTLVANGAYWGYELGTSHAPGNMVAYFDTQLMLAVRQLVNKVGWEVAEREFGETAVRYAQDCWLEERWAFDDVFILDDLNRNVVPDPESVRAIGSLLSRRWDAQKPMWLITNESLDFVQASWPRIFERMVHDPDWQIVEKSEVVARSGC